MSEANAVYNSNNFYGLPAKAASEAFDSFTQYDKNHNGTITAEEMKVCLRGQLMEFKETDVDELFSKHMDLNADGNVSLDEYMKFMAKVYRHECEGFKLPTHHIKH